MTKIVFVGTRVSDLSNTWGVAGNDIYSNYSGNVGIGSSTPTAKLDVSGNARVTGNMTICGTLFVTDISGVVISGGGGGSSQWGDNGSDIYYNSGNVGIGTSAPAYPLDVSGDMRAGTIYADNIETTSGVIIDISNIDGVIQFGSQYTLVIDPLLNRVGVGKEGPDVTLDVAGDAAISGTLNVGSIALAGEAVIDLSGATDYVQIGSNNALYVDTALNRVGVGKANPTTTLDVSGNVTMVGDVNIDAGALFVNGTNNRVGVNTTTPSTALDVSGAATISGNLTVDTNTLFVDASNNRVGIGMTNPSVALDVVGEIKASSAITIGSNSVQRMFLETSKSTSGKVIEFTVIPEWAKKITIMFNNLSPTASDNLLIQLGTSSSYEATGYACCSTRCSGSVSTTAFTTSFGIALAQTADNLSGNLILTTVSTNTWVASWTLGSSGTTQTYFGGGSKTINSTLTRIQLALTTPNFDGGSVNILIEGY